MTRSPILSLILLTTLLRLLFAATTGLGVDESYMVTAGRALSGGYFDHPPASWWLSWGAAHLFGTDMPVVVRLPFILLFAASQALMAAIATLIAGRRAAFWAVVALNLSPVFGITTGTWVLPDGPLDAALLGGAWCLLRGLSAPPRRALGWWAGAGVGAGLALFSKYSAILPIGGFGLFMLLHPLGRRWLRQPHPYLAGLLCVLVFSPVLLWNATHGWASFAFQGDRAIGWHFHPLASLVTLGGEALFILPWFWVPMMVLFLGALWPFGVGHSGRWPITRRQVVPTQAGSITGPASTWHVRLLAAMAAPAIVAFALIAAWSSQRILYHWAAPGYLLLFPVLGQAIAQREQQRWVRWTLGSTAVVVVLSLGIIAAQMQFDILGNRLAGVMRRDPTQEALDWTSVRSDLQAQGLLTGHPLFAALNWREAGKFGYALGSPIIPLCLNEDARQFQFARPPGRFAGQDVIILSLLPADRAMRDAAPWFRSIEQLPDAAISLNGRRLDRVTVLRGRTLMPDTK